MARADPLGVVLRGLGQQLALRSLSGETALAAVGAAGPALPQSRRQLGLVGYGVA